MSQATDSMRDLIKLLGPEVAAKLTRPPTHAEERQIAAALERHGSASAALGVTDPELAAQIDALPVNQR